MASVSDVVGLLYRADWTRLSLAAEVSIGFDPGLTLKRSYAATPPSPFIARPEPADVGGFRSRSLTLLIAPGRRYREEDEESAYIAGCDGERRWMRSAAARAAEDELAGIPGDPHAPLPQLLCPAPLLTGFVLDVRGPVTACGRDAVHVIATPRPSMRDVTMRRHLRLDRIEVIVDTQLGILLLRQEMFD